MNLDNFKKRKTKIKFATSLDENTHNALIKFCEENKLHINDVVNHAIEQLLKKHGEDKK